MTTDDRWFYFDPGTTMDEALAAIRAALDDEGLALGPRGGSADGVRSAVVDGAGVFVVPASRIMTREDDARMRAALRMTV